MSERDELGDHVDGLLAKFRAVPGACPGYGGDTCDRTAEYFQYLVNDPRAYCREHSLAAARFWSGMGFPSPPYMRLSDGACFRIGPVGDEAQSVPTPQA